MILDTNAVSALFDGNAALAEVLSKSDTHHLPVIVLGEYRFGLIRSRARRMLARMLDELQSESIVVPIDERTSTIYAKVREQLRVTGKPIPSNDLWIAALAIQHGLPLASLDGHFDSIHGLQRVSWEA